MIIKTPDLPHDMLGIADDMICKVAILKRTIYLVEHWDGATVPTEARPGDWKLAVPGYETEAAALAYLASLPEDLVTFYRISRALSVEAREVWVRRGDRRPPKRGVDEAHPTLLACARAWARAIERQDVGEIEKCEGELILAIARCGG